MFEYLRRLGNFLTTMDARTITSLCISIFLLCFVIVMFVYGQQWLRLDDENELTRVMFQAANSPWAIVGVISVYSLLALTGFPQILLITATIIVFGPLKGAGYSWVATMFSATLTFGLGHFLGGGWVRRLGGDRVQRTIDFARRYGVLASGLVRVVPSGPFIVVNAAAGAAHIPIWKYWLGTGMGIIPKIALVGVLSLFAPDQRDLASGVSGLLDFFTSREPRDLAIIVGIIVVWIGFLFFVRQLYRRLRQRESLIEN